MNAQEPTGKAESVFGLVLEPDQQDIHAFAGAYSSWSAQARGASGLWVPGSMVSSQMLVLTM
jgi:hypothetical protein